MNLLIAIIYQEIDCLAFRVIVYMDLFEDRPYHKVEVFKMHSQIKGQFMG